MTETGFIKVFGSSELFQGMDSGALDAALRLFRCRIVRYKKSGFLHHSETVLPAFGLVLSGTVRACTDDIDGNRMIMADVSAGKTFGESLCFLKAEDSPVYVYAAEDSVIAWLSPDGVFSNAEDPLALELQRRFTAMLARRTLGMNRRIQVLSKLRIRDKLIAFFSDLVLSTGSDSFTISMSREDLAAYIGTERSALSRELSRMKKEGLIEYRGNSFRLIRK